MSPIAGAANIRACQGCCGATAGRCTAKCTASPSLLVHGSTLNFHLNFFFPNSKNIYNGAAPPPHQALAQRTLAPGGSPTVYTLAGPIS